MPQHTVYLFYAPANRIEAELLQRELQANSVGCVTGPTTTNKVDQLRQDEDGLAVLLVSDNYLKDLDEMHFLSSVLNHVKDAQLMPVLTHGRRAKEDDIQQMEVYGTHIATLNDVMRYRDFWYEEWIALRKQHKTAPESEQQAISARKDIAKNMSVGSISNHIRHLNKLEPIDWDAFSANGFDHLLQQVDTLPAEANPTAEADASTTEETTTSIQETIQPYLEQPLTTDAVEEETTVVQETLVDEHNDEEEATTGVDVIAETLVDASNETSTHTGETQFADEEEAVEPPQEAAYQGLNGSEVDDQGEEDPESEGEEQSTEHNGTEQDETEGDEPLQGSTEETEGEADPVGALPQSSEEERIPVAEIVPPEDETEGAEETTEQGEALEELDSATILEMYEIQEVDDVDTLFHIAEAQLEEGETTDARHTYERILSLDPYNGRALIWLARLLAHHEENAQPREAADLYRKAIMINDENAQLYYEYGLLQQEAFKAYRKAADAYREALTIDAYYEDAYFGLANCLRELGQREAAKANYLQACLLDADRFETADHDHHFDVLRHRAPEEELPEEPDAEAEGAGLYDEQHPNANHVVLVTGATSGIGRAIAGRFVMDGYKVILAGRRSERLAEIKTTMEEHLAEAQVHTLTLDVRQPSAVKEAIQNLPEGWNHIDILINNAGLAKGFAPIHEGDLDHWETMIDTNLKGLLYVSRAVTPGMVERGSGHVVNIGSVAGVQAYSGGGVYCATKAAVDSLTRSMRLDLYQHGIKVTAVHPGHVENTEFAEVRYDDADKANIYEDFKPLAAKDVADTVHYVASRPEHVNIQNVLLFGTQQASATDIDRSGREDMVIA